MKRVIATDLVRVSLAGVLLLAAGLKGYQLRHGAGSGHRPSRFSRF